MGRMKVALIGMLVVGVAGSAMAQAVTEADLGRLDVAAAEVTRHAAVLKASAGALAFEVDRAVALLKEEIIYLRVRLRREGTVPRTEYIDLRDRLETLRVKAVGQKVTAHPVIGDDPVSGGWIVPVGTEMDVRLQTPLSSRTARLEQRFEATSVVDCPGPPSISASVMPSKHPCSSSSSVSNASRRSQVCTSSPSPSRIVFQRRLKDSLSAPPSTHEW